VVQPIGSGRPDVHRWSLSDWFETLQDLD
jgi:hypothetical protein